MSPSSLTLSRHPRRLAGFSLVEVAAALAIATFSLAGIIGLVPIGLNNFREAINTTVGTQMAQQVLTDAEQTDFDLLIANAGVGDTNFFALPVRYFDEQGNEVRAEDASAAAKIVYHVRLRGSLPGPADSSLGGDSFTSLPGFTRFRPRESVFVTVQVAWHPGLTPLPIDEGRQLWLPTAAPMSTYRGVITRNGTTKSKSL